MRIWVAVFLATLAWITFSFLVTHDEPFLLTVAVFGAGILAWRVVLALSLPNSPRLRRAWYGPRSSEGAGELGENRQVGVKLDPLKPTDAERE